MSDETNVIAQVDTPLGAALVRMPVTERIFATAEIVEIRSELPAGMRVDRAIRIDVRIKAVSDIGPLMFAFLLDGPHDGSPETGEWLDSIRFAAQRAQLSIGTRDATWMLTHGVERKFVPAHLRADPAEADFSSWLLHYRPQGFLVEIEQLVRGDAVICPLAAAYASSQPDSQSDESTWFAVDYALP